MAGYALFSFNADNLMLLIESVNFPAKMTRQSTWNVALLAIVSSSFVCMLSDLGWKTNKHLSNLRHQVFWQRAHWTFLSREPLWVNHGNLSQTKRKQSSSDSADPWLGGHAVSNERLLITMLFLFRFDFTLWLINTLQQSKSPARCTSHSQAGRPTNWENVRDPGTIALRP